MRTILYLTILVLLATSCRKSADKPAQAPDPDAPVLVSFYSSSAVATVKVIEIRVGGQLAGYLKYSSTMPSCGAAGFPGLSLKPGSYAADYIDVNASQGHANRQITFTVPSGSTSCIFLDLK